VRVPWASQAAGYWNGVDLLERAEPLSALLRALREARAGQGGLVLLSGEAGVGKTAVLRRFAAIPGERGEPARVLWGTCDPLFTPRPLGPFLDIAEQVAGEFGALVRRGARPHETLAAFLAELGATRPTVAVLEDVHWADEASLDLLGLVARRIEPAGALVVASFRDDELEPAHPLQTMLGGLATVPALVRLRLEPLSAGAVRTMAEPFGADEVELYRKTGGNPFFVTEVLSSGEARIPPTVRDAVLARVSRTGRAGRRLLEAVAIVPSPVEPWLLDVLAGDDVSRFEECLASGMLVHERGRAGFRHELARLAVEESILPPRRLALHRVALRALGASPAGSGDPARMAYHAEQATDAEAVLRFAPDAARRAAAVGAHREAAAQFGRALRFAESLPLEARAWLLEGRAYECYLTDQPDQALAARREALEVYRILGDGRREGESLCWLSRLLFFTSRNREAEEVGQAAVKLLESMVPGRELAMTYSTMSHMRMLAGDWEETITWGERAIALAERLGETEVLVHALNNVGTAQYCAGTPEGRARLERSLDLARRAGLSEHVVRAFVNLASVAVDLRDYGTADGYLAAGIEYAAEHDIDAWRWYLLAVRARSEFERGRWPEAAGSGQAVLAVARPTSFARLTALVVLARIRARRGEPGCWPLLDEARDIALLNANLQQIGPVAAARAEAALLEGDQAAVCRETDEWVELARRRADRWILGELAYWRWKAGASGEDPQMMAEPFAQQVAGTWAAAADCWERLGCPYEAAGALADGGDEQALRRALATMSDLGARPMAAALAGRLRALGVRVLPRGPRAATSRNPAGLTDREREVLDLLVKGLSNAEIAASLVLSAKTVEHHVSAILRKLGVGSRREARSAALRDGLVPQT
jgi:DNA-binding CsgD family transcriptional regulator/tetratricopeptide (TPR) repeat protein